MNDGQTTHPNVYDLLSAAIEERQFVEVVELTPTRARRVIGEPHLFTVRRWGQPTLLLYVSNSPDCWQVVPVRFINRLVARPHHTFEPREIPPEYLDF